jgi:hypothetical protein
MKARLVRVKPLSMVPEGPELTGTGDRPGPFWVAEANPIEPKGASRYGGAVVVLVDFGTLAR